RVTPSCSPHAGGSAASYVAQERLDIARRQASGDGWFLFQVSELLHCGVVQDASHELKFPFQAGSHHLTDGVPHGQYGHPGLCVGGEPQTVDPVKALKEASSHEVPVYVHGVMADMVEADSLTQCCRVRDEHHARRVFPEAAQLLLPVRGAAVDDSRTVLLQHALQRGQAPDE